MKMRAHSLHTGPVRRSGMYEVRGRVLLHSLWCLHNRGAFGRFESAASCVQEGVAVHETLLGPPLALHEQHIVKELPDQQSTVSNLECLRVMTPP